YREGLLWVTDLASANGTFIEGEQIPPYDPKKIIPSIPVSLGKDGPHLTFEVEIVEPPKEEKVVDELPFEDDGLLNYSDDVSIQKPSWWKKGGQEKGAPVAKSGT